MTKTAEKTTKTKAPAKPKDKAVKKPKGAVAEHEHKMKIPIEMRKELLDTDITFVEWCLVYGFKRETARNVASGAIKGTRGDSKKILAKLREDFPECFGGSRPAETPEEKATRRQKLYKRVQKANKEKKAQAAEA